MKSVEIRSLGHRAAVACGVAALWVAPVAARPAWAGNFFAPGNLVVSRSVYQGVASTVPFPSTLPNGAASVADGTYPNVWKNETPDPSFGVTSPIFLDQLTPAGTLVNSLTVPTSIVTSFPSKSEASLNLSADGKSLTFMGYSAAVNALDISNANTPGHVDPTNPVPTVAQRAIGSVDSQGSLAVTPVNAYSGNNGRAAIEAGGNYYLVGNAGNSGKSPTGATLAMLSDNTGVQMIAKGSSGDTTVVGAVNGTSGSATGYQRGFSVASVPDPAHPGQNYAADKTGKDDNFRGETIFNNTLFVTKGSGGNGINTVYQVGTAGHLPTAADAATTPITILPGLPTDLASANTASHPFGIWFADSHTLYVADEGNQKASDTAATNLHAGLEKWSFDGSTWHLDYTLTNGLNLDVKYAVPGLDPTLNPATDGLRNLTGHVNGDGTVTLYAITSTVSAATDQGADPNKLVAITDTLSFTNAAQAATELFSTLQSAGNGEVLRGVSFAPVPEPSSVVLGALGLVSLLGLVGLRRSKTA